MGTTAGGEDKFAIIGLGCRMPPNANSLPAFWKFLLRGGNALRSVKPDRWDVRQFFDADPKRPGKSYAPKAAFLDADIQLFDPLAFGISPREANCIDPQQRLLLEVTWEAFEDAGMPLERVSGSATGVFIGGFCLDHLILQMRPANRYLLNAHSPGGATMTVLSNRISHVFNLRGPSFTLDTACSSSLVAIHCACQSLRSGESEMAIAGGVNVMSLPDNPIMMSKGHFLSPHGECHTFDETAAGYARGEGAGVFLIKPLVRALADGDPIHAVIAGSGVNQDGHTDGISLPNTVAQEELVRDVYRRSDLVPGEVDYVEAHGTGTQAGDPAEARALHVNFSKGRDPGRKLVVGSVKTNVGHLEAAAGVAGMLKGIGALQAREVPKNLHFKKPNPKIPFDDYCLKVPVETTKLPNATEKSTLTIGVNSFGYGGTNAHVILESAPARVAVPAPDEPGRPRLITLSARSEEALRDLAAKYAFQLGQPLPGTFADLAHTTAHRRSHLEWRCAAVAATPDELRDQLIATSTGQPHATVAISTEPADKAAELAFIYTGMGPQWWAMGHELIRTQPIIAATIDEIDMIFTRLAGWSLKDAMLADETSSRMACTEVAQPANFALQVALTRWWAAHGIRPSAVIGHSVGEVASAYVAGVYTLEEAVTVSYHRSRLQQTTAGLGAMLAVGLAESDALVAIGNRTGVSIGAINSFEAVTLSGDKAQLEEIAAELTERDIFSKFLRVEVAYHSPQMDPIRDELLAALAGLAPKEPTMPLYSTAHGRIVPASDWGADYWWHNVRQPVRFADAVQALFDDGFATMLEVGPHPVLGNSIKECAAHLERKAVSFVSLRRAEPELPRLMLTLGELYCAGHTLDWTALAPDRGQFLRGPQYPWQKRKHWLESETSQMDRLGLPGPVYLNRSVPSPNPCWEVEINRAYFPFLFDHGVQDQTVFAGMGYVEAAIALSARIHEKTAVVLENVSFEKVLIVDDTKLQYLVTELSDDESRFTISSRIEGDETGRLRHCRGRVNPQTQPPVARLDLASLKSECATDVEIDALYERLATRSLRYGPTFRPIQKLTVGQKCFLAEIDGTSVLDASDHALHPTLMDAALQPVLYCAEGDQLFVPFSIEQLQYFGRPDSAELYAFGRVVLQTETLIVADVWLLDSEGRIFAHARRISCQLIETESRQNQPGIFYQLDWNESSLNATGAVDDSRVLIVTNPQSSILTRLEEKIPGAAVVSWDHASSGMGTKSWIERLTTEEISRRDIIILECPTLPGEVTGYESLQFSNERLIGFFQALAAGRSGRSDVTIVSKSAKAVLPEDEISLDACFSAGAIGLVAQNECESLFVRSIDLPAATADTHLDQILLEIAAESRGEIALRGIRRFECVLEATAPETAAETVTTVSLETPLELRLGTKGKLESLRFEPAARTDPGTGEIEVRVHSAALNYKDLLKIYGRLHPIALENTYCGPELGMECAGVVVRCADGSRFQPGDRVAAPLKRGYRTYVTIPERFASKIPESLGMEAAAIPIVYMAAFRGLIDIAGLKQGERVLIHHGTGGLGLAAIDVAKSVGAEIFATAGSSEKQDYLRSLGIDHVYSSRDLDFGQGIREDTAHEGIDVVISAQTGQAMHVSLNLLRAGGRYIEVGKKDIAEDNGLPLAAFNRNLIFASVDVDQLTNQRPDVVEKLLARIFDGFAHGEFTLGPTQTFSAPEFHEAFSVMARSKQIGKLLVDLSHGEVSVFDKPEVDPVVAADGCYIVTGGTSGFGLMSALWLASHGAGRILLASRSGRNAPGVNEALERIAARGVDVEAISVDVTNEEQVRALVTEADAGAYRLRGILHAAMVLDDAMIEAVNETSFRRVFAPKVAGALHLAAAVADKPDLDFFLLFSSISSLIGNRGQASYVAANGVFDGLAHALRKRGLPATSVNWGALAETGVVARDERLGSVLASGGVTGLTNREALAALEVVLRLPVPQVGVFKVDWAQWNDVNPRLATDPRFKNQRILDEGRENPASAIRAELANLSKEQRLVALQLLLQEVLAEILKMSAENVPMNRKLNEMGVDSLLVLELGLGIKERLGISFSAMEFLKGPTVQQLASMSETKLWGA